MGNQRGHSMLRSSLAALLIAAPLASACAQQPPAPAERHVPEAPHGVSGTVVTMSEDMVVLRQADGADISMSMTPGWTVGKLRSAAITELRLGDFIGSANADTGPDAGRANELRVFEPGYRPEYGTHSIATPGTSMTHGFVFGIAKRDGGTEFEVAYPGGRRAILVPESTTVTISDLQLRSAAVGAAVSAVTRPGSDGVRRASRLILAERK
jgi:hypothetical protein